MYNKNNWIDSMDSGLLIPHKTEKSMLCSFKCGWFLETVHSLNIIYLCLLIVCT